jgi:hypothetical protein
VRFPYTRFNVRGTRANSRALVLRPMVDVRVIGPAGKDIVTALVDSGSDDTLLEGVWKVE